MKRSDINNFTGGGRPSFLSGQGFTDVSHPELVSGSKEAEVVETDKDRFRTKFGMTKTPRHPELVSGLKETEAVETDKDRFRTKFGMTKTPRHPELVSGSFGFTLAEVLITLGIIGIVAAMTLPAITANTRKSETIARLKKFNSMMAQAITLSESVNGDSIYWEKDAGSLTEDENGNAIYDNDLGPKATYKFFMKYIAPYIKYYRIEESVQFPDLENPEKFTKIYFADGTEAYVKNGACIDFYYDVNGERKPNKSGYDIFTLGLCPWHSSTYFGNSNRKWGAICSSNDKNDRDELIRKKACPARILELDGWKFKKDYPFRI